MSGRRRPPVRVFGVGHPERGDDAVGVWVARRLRGRVDAEVHEITGDPLALIAAWEGARLAIVVDAMCGGGAPGTIRRFDATRAPLPVPLATSTSSHGIGVADAIELARVLGRLPARLLVIGIEAVDFTLGSGPGRAGHDAITRVVCDVVRACRRAGAPPRPRTSGRRTGSTRGPRRKLARA